MISKRYGTENNGSLYRLYDVRYTILDSTNVLGGQNKFRLAWRQMAAGERKRFWKNKFRLAWRQMVVQLKIAWRQGEKVA